VRHIITRLNRLYAMGDCGGAFILNEEIIVCDIAGASRKD
jgi:hypothetical protein